MTAAPFVFETETVDEDYEDFFSIDDEMYQIRKVIPSTLSLKALRIIREEGESAFIPWMFDEICSEGAYRALEDCESISAEQLQQVVRHVEKRVLGPLEKAQGKSSHASWRSAGP